MKEITNDDFETNEESDNENELPEFTIGKSIFLPDIDVFEDVGRAVWAGLLDLTDTNPLSRLPNSEFKNLQGVRKAIEKHVDQIWGLDEQPPEIKEEKKPVHSIPRVALIGPKRITKTYEERMEEK